MYVYIININVLLIDKFLGKTNFINKKKIVRVAMILEDEVKLLYKGYEKKVHHCQISSL